jgi:hypothetical protein
MSRIFASFSEIPQAHLRRSNTILISQRGLLFPQISYCLLHWSQYTCITHLSKPHPGLGILDSEHSNAILGNNKSLSVHLAPDLKPVPHLNWYYSRQQHLFRRHHILVYCHCHTVASQVSGELSKVFLIEAALSNHLRATHSSRSQIAHAYFLV